MIKRCLGVGTNGLCWLNMLPWCELMPKSLICVFIDSKKCFIFARQMTCRGYRASCEERHADIIMVYNCFYGPQFNLDIYAFNFTRQIACY